MLVAFEGIDGSGKSTLIKAVAAQLKKRGLPVVATVEPTTTALGRLVRTGLRERYDPLIQAGLFLTDRACHIATLFPAIVRDEIVLTDRYVDSTTAYQANALAGRFHDPLSTLAMIQDLVFPTPNLVVWLDLPPAAALKRIQGRDVKEPYEKARFLEGVRKNYEALSKMHPERWLRLDARATTATLATQVVEAVLGEKRRDAAATTRPRRTRSTRRR